MAGPLYFDRVKETTTTTGTGTVTLDGAATGFQDFSVVGDGNSCSYCIADAANWEVGIGTYTASGTTLSRTTVLASSNSGSLVSFTSGTKDVFLTQPAALVAQNPAQCDGRLTLESGVPVSKTDQTAKTSVYFTPYLGNRVALYNGSAWISYAFSELTLSVGTVTSDTNYDVFLYNNSGTLTLEKVAWTNDTTRATSIVRQDGVYVKNGAATRRYIGTVRSTSTTTVEDSQAKRYVFNQYNRVGRSMRNVPETTDSWSYSSTTWQQANANTANQLDYVDGDGSVFVTATVQSGFSTSSGAFFQGVGVGVDSTTVNSAGFCGSWCSNAIAIFPVSSYSGTPGVGRHYLAWLESGQGGGASNLWYGDASGAFQSGIVGHAVM